MQSSGRAQLGVELAPSSARREQRQRRTEQADGASGRPNSPAARTWALQASTAALPPFEAQQALPTAYKKVEVELGSEISEIPNSKNHRNAETRECLKFRNAEMVGRRRGRDRVRSAQQCTSTVPVLPT